MDINESLLRDTLTWIVEHPEQHDQFTWVRIPERLNRNTEYLKFIDAAAAIKCGSKACLAGWTVLLGNGCKLVAEPEDLQIGFVLCEGAAAKPPTRARYTYETDARSIRATARDMLGLTDFESDWLFGGNNSLFDLFAMSHVLTDGRIEIPESVGSSAELATWLQNRSYNRHVEAYAERNGGLG